jgi:hypothetical protein
MCPPAPWSAMFPITFPRPAGLVTAFRMVTPESHSGRAGVSDDKRVAEFGLMSALRDRREDRRRSRTKINSAGLRQEIVAVEAVARGSAQQSLLQQVCRRASCDC